MTAYDEAQPPFNFNGYRVPVRLDLALTTRKLLHAIQVEYAKPNLRSPITTTLNGRRDKYMTSQFYSLRYACSREVYNPATIGLDLGMAVNATAFLKTFVGAGMSQTSYEGIVRLEGVGRIFKQYSSKGHLDLELYIPFCSYLVHRGYALGEQEQQIAGIWKLHGLEFDINNRFRIASHTEVLCGYNLLFYDCEIGSKVTTVAQQLYAGFVFTF